MLANFAALGLLAAIRSDTGPPADLQVFRAPVRWLGGALALAAVVLLVVAARVQVARRGRARRQAASRRPGRRRAPVSIQPARPRRRAPDSARDDRRPRGAGARHRRPRALRKPARRVMRRLGLSLDSACPDPAARCYPLGGRAFHLLGDAGTRTNWSATNTSFVERDSEARLRGFDDHQTPVTIAETRRHARHRRCGATTAISFRSSGIGTTRSTRPSRRRHGPAARAAADDRRAAAGARRRDPRRVRAPIVVGARGRRGRSIPTPAICWPASAIRGRATPSCARRPTPRRRTSTRCWIARATACIRPARRSSW